VKTADAASRLADATTRKVCGDSDTPASIVIIIVIIISSNNIAAAADDDVTYTSLAAAVCEFLL